MGFASTLPVSYTGHSVSVSREDFNFSNKVSGDTINIAGKGDYTFDGLKWKKVGFSLDDIVGLSTRLNELTTSITTNATVLTTGLANVYSKSEIDTKLSVKQNKLSPGYIQLANASGSGSVLLDYSAGSMLQFTLTGDINVSPTNFVSGEVCTFFLELVGAGAYNVDFPSGTKFVGGVLPTFTEEGTDLLMIIKDKNNVYTVTVLGTDIKEI